MKHRIILLAIAALAAFEAAAARPRLVVNIVVGSMRAEDLGRYADNYGEGGLRRLLDGGTVFADSRYDYQQTTTPVSLATLTTGAMPSTHGVIGARWRDYVENDAVELIAGRKGPGPYNLIAPTLAEALLQHEPGAKAVSVATEAMSAVIMAGHGGEAFWLDSARCGWETSPYYAPEVPEWVARSNRERYNLSYIAPEWRTLYEKGRYLNTRNWDIVLTGKSRKDKDEPGEGRLKLTSDYDKMLYTPAGNTAVLGFAIEPRTAAALHETAPLLTYIAPERILSEMDRALCGGHILPVLLDYPDVLAVFLPEIAPCVGFDQCNRHHIYDVWGHSAHAAAAIAPEPVLRWTMLLHDVGKPACFTRDEQGVGHFYGHPAVSAELAEGACRRLRMDSRSAERIVTLVRWHDRDIPRTDRAIARAVGKLGEDVFRQLLAVKRADNAAQSPDDRHRLADIQRAEDILDGLLARQQCFSLRDLAVKGGDMAALGLRGREIGDMLRALLDAVLDARSAQAR